MRALIITSAFALLAACSAAPRASDVCVRGETGGEFTSNVDGEGGLYYTCPHGPPPSCTYSTRDIHNMPLYVCS